MPVPGFDVPGNYYDPDEEEPEEKLMSDFRWLIEAPGQRYLAVQRLNMSDNFEWTTDHNKALAFRSQEQADALMMAVRQMDRILDSHKNHGKLSWGELFSFEPTLGNAKAVEHGWFRDQIDREPDHGQYAKPR